MTKLRISKLFKNNAETEALANAMIENLRNLLKYKALTGNIAERKAVSSIRDIENGLNRFFINEAGPRGATLYSNRVDLTRSSTYGPAEVQYEKHLANPHLGLTSKTYEVLPYESNSWPSSVLGINFARFVSNPTLATNRFWNRFISGTLASPQVLSYNRQAILETLKGKPIIIQEPGHYERRRKPGGYINEYEDIFIPGKINTTYEELPEYSDDEVMQIREAALKHLLGYLKNPILDAFDKPSLDDYLRRVLGVGVPVSLAEFMRNKKEKDENKQYSV